MTHQADPRGDDQRRHSGRNPGTEPWLQGRPRRAFWHPANVRWMGEAAADREPGNGSGKGDTSGQSPAARGSVAVDSPPAAAVGAGGIQLPAWAKVLGWCGTAGLIYLLICAVSIISRGFGKLLKLLMAGKARDILTKAVGRNAHLAMASGMGVTVLTQSSTVTNSVLVPFAGAGILTPAQVYPVTVGANLGTTFTTVFAAFAVVGQDAKIGLQAAFVHLLYNVFAIIVIYVIPVLRPVPLFCAETLARVAAERKWVVAVYLITVFIALPALVIILVGVL